MEEEISYLISSLVDIILPCFTEHNKPPIARAGKSKIVWLPTSSITLDGRNSTDDTKIVKYAWTQIRLVPAWPR